MAFRVRRSQACHLTSGARLMSFDPSKGHGAGPIKLQRHSRVCSGPEQARRAVRHAGLADAQHLGIQFRWGLLSTQ